MYVNHHRALPNKEVFETLATPDQTIVVMMRGEQDLESFKGGLWRRAVYRAGTVGMTPGGETDRLRRCIRRQTVAVEKVALYVPQQVFRETADYYRRAGQRVYDEPLVALAFDDPTIVHGVLALLRGMKVGAPDLYAQATVQWLATHLLSTHSRWRSLDEGGRDPGVIRDPRLARVMDYMSAHFDEVLTLDRLAQEAGVSKFHFSRLFRASTGLSPHVFLVQLRMQAARRMLTTTDLGVATIATRCGFAQPVHFGTAFTKRFGLSPTAFRARSRA